MGTKRVMRYRQLVAVGALALIGVACGGGDEGTSATEEPEGAAAGTPEVVIENFQFVPQEIEVAEGTTVTWTNQDEVAHTVQDEGDLFPESEDLAQGQTFSFTYERAGSFPYICGIHPYMKGTVTVS